MKPASTSTISSKNQVVVPANIRQALNLKAGDIIDWQIITGSGKVIAKPAKTSITSAARGMGKEIWEQVDLESYVKGLRQEWSDQN